MAIDVHTGFWIPDAPVAPSGGSASPNATPAQQAAIVAANNAMVSPAAQQANWDQQAALAISNPTMVSIGGALNTPSQKIMSNITPEALKNEDAIKLPNPLETIQQIKPPQQIQQPQPFDINKLNTTPLGNQGVNALFKQYYGRNADAKEVAYWSTKSDKQLRPALFPNSAVQLFKNSQSAVNTGEKLPVVDTVSKGKSTLDSLDQWFKDHETPEQKQSGDLNSLLQKLIPETAGQAQALQDQYNAPGGYNETKQELNNAKGNLNSLIAQREALNVAQEGKPMTMARLLGAEAQIGRVYDSKILTQTALVNTLIGNVAQAKDDAESAVNAKYAGKLEAIAIAEAQLNALAPVLSKQEKEQAAALQQQYDLQKIDIQRSMTDETSINTIGITAKENGAPASVITKIFASKTLADALNNAGTYVQASTTGDLTAEYKNWTLAGGQEGTGMSFAEWQGKTPGGEVSPYQAERSSRTLQSIDELIPQINGKTVGWASLLSGVPTTEAKYFKGQLDTLKSNIAFGELTAMREASKTGGALGQVSDKEGQLLQSALGSLDQAQSETQVKAQLEKIKASILRWNSALGASTNSSMSDFNW